jgi:hypothetical protein
MAVNSRWKEVAMENEEFIYWLKGFAALSDDAHLDQRQFKIINSHANLVKEVCGILDTNVAEFMVTLQNLMSENQILPASIYQRLIGELGKKS